MFSKIFLSLLFAYYAYSIVVDYDDIPAGWVNCTEASVIKYSCRRNVILIWDSSPYMKNKSFIDQEFNFTIGHLAPPLHMMHINGSENQSYVEIAQMLWGSGSTVAYPMVEYLDTFCIYINDVIGDAQILPNVSYDTMANMLNFTNYVHGPFNSTTIVLFTGSENQTDIDQGGEMLKNLTADITDFNIAVVNFGSKYFVNFPRGVTKVYKWDAQNQEQLAQYIDEMICDPNATPAPPTTTSQATTNPVTTTTSKAPKTRKPRTKPTLPTTPKQAITTTSTSPAETTMKIDSTSVQHTTDTSSQQSTTTKSCFDVMKSNYWSGLCLIAICIALV